MLHALTHVISEHRANITYVDIGDRHDGRSSTYFELSDVGDPIEPLRELAALPIVRMVERSQPFAKIYGKRIIVVSLNMVGTVPDAADLVVTDPVQAGVMAVMAIARTATFDIARVRGQRF